MSAYNQDVPVRFYVIARLINLFSRSQSNEKLMALKKKLNIAQILILDDFRYVPYDHIGSQLLFDYIMRYAGRIAVSQNPAITHNAGATTQKLFAFL